MSEQQWAARLIPETAGADTGVRGLTSRVHHVITSSRHHVISLVKHDVTERLCHVRSE